MCQQYHFENKQSQVLTYPNHRAKEGNKIWTEVFKFILHMSIPPHWLRSEQTKCDCSIERFNLSCNCSFSLEFWKPYGFSLLHLQISKSIRAIFLQPALFRKSVFTLYRDIDFAYQRNIFKVLFMKSVGENLFHSEQISKHFLESCLRLL